MDASLTPWLPTKSTDDHSSTLRPDARSTGATTLRSSFDSRPPAGRNADALNHPKQGPIPARSLIALSTPHDRILEKMYHHPGKSEGALPISTAIETHHSPPLDRDYSQTGDPQYRTAVETNRHQSAKLNSSPTPTASFASNTFPETRLYDPFDGSPLGIVIPAEAAARSGDVMATSGESGSNDDVWAHLSRVLDLQHQIARMHVAMEGLGPGTDNKGKGPMGGGFTRQRTTSTTSMPGADIGDEEGIGVADEEAEKLKAREREFKKLATQFEGRKEGINNMMSKLDDLSKALSEFHSLQVPKIEFPSSSRNNTLSPTLSDQMQSPVIISPSDSASAFSHIESSLRPPVMRSSLPTVSSQVPSEGLIPPSDSAAGTPFPPTSLGRKAYIPTLLINSIEPVARDHMVDSPASTVSLKLPQGNS